MVQEVEREVLMQCRVVQGLQGYEFGIGSSEESEERSENELESLEGSGVGEGNSESSKDLERNKDCKPRFLHMLGTLGDKMGSVEESDEEKSGKISLEEIDGYHFVGVKPLVDPGI